MAERVFNSFSFENEYFRSVQFEVFVNVIRIFKALNEIPTFLKLYEAINTPALLTAVEEKITDVSLREWLTSYAGLPATERIQRVSGLSASLNHFAFGETASLFNATKPDFSLDEALRKDLIVYFQLPVLLKPFLGKASGKMILQCLQSAVANRHIKRSQKKFFSVFLDDFTEYLYEGFVSILNKSRSANVGIVFAHQALGDIETLGDPIANSILTNANMKICMRCNDPDSAEYFSKAMGTSKTTKLTERVSASGLFRPRHKETGEASARQVEEFRVHPNKFKSELGTGEAVVLVPHANGSKVIEMKFEKYDDLPPEKLPMILKHLPESLHHQKKETNAPTQPANPQEALPQRTDPPPPPADRRDDVPVDDLAQRVRN